MCSRCPVTEDYMLLEIIHTGSLEMTVTLRDSAGSASLTKVQAILITYPTLRLSDNQAAQGIPTISKGSVGSCTWSVGTDSTGNSNTVWVYVQAKGSAPTYARVS